MIHDQEQHELLHIRAMVLELERLVQNGDDLNPKTSVVHAQYWRNRINALLATPMLARATADQASALLQTLNCIAAGQQKGK
ncbi:hypothetical protein RI103_37285 (plasmid) [Paraburkholderia sp. FT54]|uniref:hypothetical protein n=1 Tax=Paraburkholderia sp. FT54 TaxID=3074437 RepID=UPI002877700F|nr:hypothetical protein [Paraburkholderia sp. FT54]WNC95395.1 hypothetical protein RI103_37285 [Paraburkholderia sp. FT54]